MRGASSTRSGPTIAVALVALLLLGGAWALALPTFSGPDEPAHVFRAVSVTAGEWRGPAVEHVERRADGSVFRNPGNRVRVPAGLVDLARSSACFPFRPEVPADCREPVPDDREPVEVVTAAGSYPPLYHALVGFPGHVLHAEAAVRAMRLLTVLLCAIPLALTAGLWAGRPVRLAGLALAVTPTVVFIAGTVSPSGPEVALAVLLWALAERAVRAGRDASRRLLVGTATVGALLALVRPISPAFTVGILVMAVLVHGDRERLGGLARAPGARPAATVLAGGLALAAAWIAWADPLGTLIGTSIPGLELADAVRGSWERTPRRLAEMVGVFGWLDTDAPVATHVLWGGATAMLAVGALAVGRWRERMGVVLVAVAAVLLPVASEAMQAAEVGYVWQGRYTLPVAVGLPAIAGAAVSEWRRGRASTRAASVTAWVAVGGVVALVGAHLLAFAAAVRRHLDGLPAPLFGWVDASDPAAAGPPALLLVLALAGLAVALGGILATAVTGQGSRSRRNFPV